MNLTFTSSVSALLLIAVGTATEHASLVGLAAKDQPFSTSSLELMSPDAFRSLQHIFKTIENAEPLGNSLQKMVSSGKLESSKALLKASAGSKWSSYLFWRGFHAAVTSQNVKFAEELLNEFNPKLPLVSLSMNRLLPDGKFAEIMISQGYTRFKGSPDEIVAEVILLCRKFALPEVLRNFLATFPYLTANILKSFEDVVVKKESGIRKAFLDSGILGAEQRWHKIGSKTTAARRKTRAYFRKAVNNHDITRVRKLIKDIELPFLVEECVEAASVFSSSSKPDMFYLLAEYVSPFLVEHELKKLYQAACKNARTHVSWTLFRINHPDIPFLQLAIQDCPELLEKTELIASFAELGYEPFADEVMDILRFNILKDEIFINIVQNFASKIPKEQLPALINVGLRSRNPEILKSVLMLFRGTSKFTKTRRLALEILMEITCLHRRKRILTEKDLLSIILASIDPHFFRMTTSMDLISFSETAATPEGLQQIHKIQQQFSQRLAQCEQALKYIQAYSSSEDLSLETITSFIDNGGSWDELLIVGAKLHCERLVDMAVTNGADVFACDYESKLGLIDIFPNPSRAVTIVLLRQLDFIDEVSASNVIGDPYKNEEFRNAVEIEVEKRRASLFPITI